MNPLSFNAMNASPWMGAARPIAEQIEAAAAAGFDLVGIDRFSIEAHLAQGGTIAAIAHALATAGIGCGAITAVAMLGSEPQAPAALARGAEWAAALGAPFVQVNMGVAGAHAQTAALDEACTIVAGRARLAIEHLPNTPLARVGEVVALCHAVGFAQAGVLIDIWHQERGPDTWRDLAAVPLEAIAYVEFDDALPPEGDDLAHEMIARRTFPGMGVLDCARFAAEIRALGYAGPVSVEVLNADWRGRPLHAFAQRAFESSRGFWAD